MDSTIRYHPSMAERGWFTVITRFEISEDRVVVRRVATSWFAPAMIMLGGVLAVLGGALSWLYIGLGVSFAGVCTTLMMPWSPREVVCTRDGVRWGKRMIPAHQIRAFRHGEGEGKQLRLIVATEENERLSLEVSRGDVSMAVNFPRLQRVTAAMSAMVLCEPRPDVAGSLGSPRR